MARVYQQSQPLDHEPGEGDWQSLRQELVTLLDQVENRVRGRGPAPAEPPRETQPAPQYAPPQQYAPRVPEAPREPRYDAPTDDDLRHRDALKSVQRAISRFEEQTFAAPTPASQQPMPPNPRDSLQAAINQIRSRQDNAPPRRPAPQPQAQAQPAAPQPQMPPTPRMPDPAPMLDKLAQSVTGLSGRLERLEGEIKTQIKTGANVKDVADQVSQLAHVVELLAGAVGETGQVKRLEGQIASLGKLMAQGREVDVQTLTRRLDDVAATVGKLAELQVHYADRVQNPVETQAFQDGMASIEQSVRSVYDRIDTLEKQKALAPDDLEHVTAEMARFTEALRSGVQQPLHLVELVDALNTRISDLESGDRLLHGLRKDLGALRDAVIVSLTPRFDEIEQRISSLSDTVSTREDMAEIGRQIESLGDRIGERPIDPGIGQLEAQVRQLVARMDQTGEQLSGLAKLYTTEPAAPAMPDFDAVADMVASRTATAVQQQQPQLPDFNAVAEMLASRAATAVQQSQQPAPDMDAMAALFASRTAEVMQGWAPPAPDVDAMADVIAMRTFEAVQRHNPPDTTLADTIAALENRISVMLQAMQRDPEVDAFDGVQAGISEVNERLKRLENSLLERHVDPLPAPALGRPDIASLITEADLAPAPTAAPAPRARSDAMQRNPAEEAPLNAPPFPEPMGPVGSALEAKNGPRKRHPGLDDDISMAARYDKPVASTPPPGFVPENVALPAAPQPSAGFSEPVAVPVAQPRAETAPAPTSQAPVTASSRNTFIEAARRAASRQPQAAAKPEVHSNSLIGRALSRFQASGTSKPEPAPAPATPARALAGDKPLRTQFKPEPVAAPVAPTPVADTAIAPAVAPSIEPQIAVDGPKSKAPGNESFLLRNRKTILLAAAVIALAFLTANLVVQRLNQPADDATTTPAAPATTGGIANNVVTPPSGSDALTSSMPPRVIPMADSLKTGSIDRSAAQAFATDPSQAMPSAFAAAADLANADPNSGGITAPSAEPPAGPVKVEMPPDGVGPIDLRTAAANGDPRAQFEVAAIYTEGRAIQQDYKLAAIWYERAAAQGFAPAQYRLGSLYEQGQGVDKDLNSAKLWYERAAEAGNRMSMHNLAALYAGGQLGKQEFDSAAKWFEEAADRGMTDSQFNLGMLYARGLGVQQSLSDSFKWFSIAAQSGDKDAAKARDDIARSLDADTVAKLTTQVNAFRPAPIDLVANFAPIGTWTKSFDPGETITTKTIVESVQKALMKLGYDVGTPDGVAGAKTATAIKSFEAGTGMTQVGQVNPRLLAVLGSQPV